jgi:hypothetical protein
LLEGWRASGKSARAFSEQEGIRGADLFRWQRQSKVVGASTHRKRPSFVRAEVRVAASAESGGEGFDVLLAGTARIRVGVETDLERVGALIAAYARRSAC